MPNLVRNSYPKASLHNFNHCYDPFDRNNNAFSDSPSLTYSWIAYGDSKRNQKPIIQDCANSLDNESNQAMSFRLKIKELALTRLRITYFTMKSSGTLGKDYYET